MIARFHVSPADTVLRLGDSIDLPAAVAHHACQVLRLRVGEQLVLFDGQGGEYLAQIREAGRRVKVAILDWQAVERESPLRIVLVQALPSGDKMDWVVQKAVELGVTHVQPVMSQRCVLRLQGERRQKREAHWAQVMQAACEQSGRNRLPQLQPVLELATWLAQPYPPDETRLLLSPHQGMRLAELAAPLGGLSLLVGPEGGFDEAEEAMALARGFQRLNLGARVLRTETAGLAGVAAAQALWGDYR